MTKKHERRTRRGADRSRDEQRGERRRNRRELGQNFLRDGRTARRIVAASGVCGEDLVVELGAGGGVLTRQLARAARRVIAVELDPRWATRLGERFARNPRVHVVWGDAVKVALPDEPFVVVANVPFCATTPILHRLLDDPGSPLRSAHLVVQGQVALKHAIPSPTTLKTLNWSPWYEFAAGIRLSAEAFSPRPGVGARLMVAARRDPPLVDAGHRRLFRALVRLAFDGPGTGVGRTLRPLFTRTQLRRLAGDGGFSLSSPASALTVQQWAGVFGFMISAVPRERWPLTGPCVGEAGRRRGASRRVE